VRHRILLAGLAACVEPSRLDQPVPPSTPALVTAVDEIAWASMATRGSLAEPATEIRLLRTAQAVHLRIEARDREIVAGDAIEVTVGPLRKTIGASAAKIDGTIDHAIDEDVAWVVELALPRAQLGASPVGVVVERCEAPSADRAPVCASWSASIRPD